MIPPGRIMGLPPCFTMRSSRPNVSAFGELPLPKNSTQNAGSNENEANEFECGIDALAALGGIESSQPLVCGFGCACTVDAKSSPAAT